jgi:hypothetical protein
LDCNTNQKLEQYLHFWCSTQQDNWADWLPFTQFALNSWPNATTKTSPFELLMGHSPCAQWTPKASTNPMVEDWINGLIQLRRSAQDCLQKAQNLMAKTPKAFTPYQPGDQVWLEVGKSMGTPYPHGSWVWVLTGMGTGIALSTHDPWQPMLQPMATRVIILITT